MKLAPPHDRTHRHPERADPWPFVLLGVSGLAIVSVAWLVLRWS